MQQQLADAEQAAATSAVSAASLLQRSTAAEASCLQSEAAREQQSVQQTQIVQSLQARLCDAQAALQQSAQAAAHSDTDRQHSIQDLQQRLALALEQERLAVWVFPNGAQWLWAHGVLCINFVCQVDAMQIALFGKSKQHFLVDRHILL